MMNIEQGMSNVEVLVRVLFLRHSKFLLRCSKFIWTALLIGCGLGTAAFGQQGPAWFRSEADTAYVRDHSRDLTARLYFSRKYSGYAVRDYRQRQELLYRPNDRLNVGIGLNYGFAGLNLGVNMPGVNNDDARYGQTRYLDAQSHLYLPRFALDVYLQHYRGYYLNKPQNWVENWQPGSPHPQRGDLRTTSSGFNLQYIFNHRRFSYRAAYLQNAWQRKSAGTFLLGSEWYLIRMRADSSVTIPAGESTAFFGGTAFDGSDVYSLGANAGYAHTFVYKSHFFLTLSLVGGLALGYTRLQVPGAADPVRWGWHVNHTARIALGYNSARYFVGLSLVNLALRSQTPVGRTTISYDTGNIRLNFCRRFTVKPPRFLRRG
jgi:hypothetical protein